MKFKNEKERKGRKVEVDVEWRKEGRVKVNSNKGERKSEKWIVKIEERGKKRLRGKTGNKGRIRKRRRGEGRK